MYCLCQNTVKPFKSEPVAKKKVTEIQQLCKSFANRKESYDQQRAVETIELYSNIANQILFVNYYNDTILPVKQKINIFYQNCFINVPNFGTVPNEEHQPTFDL